MASGCNDCSSNASSPPTNIDAKAENPTEVKRVTPAMAAGIEQRVWTHRDVAALLD
jgi:hypothetical protein